MKMMVSEVVYKKDKRQFEKAAFSIYSPNLHPCLVLNRRTQTMPPEKTRVNLRFPKDYGINTRLAHKAKAIVANARKPSKTFRCAQEFFRR